MAELRKHLSCMGQELEDLEESFSKNYWSTNFAWLSGVIKINRGGYLVPLCEIEVSSLTSNELFEIECWFNPTVSFV